MKRTVVRVGALLLGALVAVSPVASHPAAAAVSLTVTPITWDIVGLDSNSPADGPHRFPVGARVCAGGGTATSVTADLAWDSTNANIDLRPGSLASVDLGSLASGECADAYFEAQVTRTAAAYDTSRAYRITATDSGSGASAKTARGRQLYVERLISQNRNGITSVKLDGTSIPAGGSMTLVVGRTYDIELAGYTATQGYNQLEAFMTLPNTIFQVLRVTTTYSADTSPFVTSPSDRLYADACGWDSDPASPNYRSCVGGDGKSGGTVVTTYRVRVVAGGGTSQTLTSLLYDFSGSSFHYNADAGVGARIASIVGPEQVTIDKAFSPKAITPGSTSTLTFTLANPTSATYTGVHFTDPFPTAMAVAASPDVTTSGCGAGGFSPALGGGETSLTFSGATLAPNGECRITVKVTAPAGSYPNTTGHLFIDTDTDTGNTASDTLLAQAAAACVPGQTLAAWTIPNGTTANPPDLAGGVPTTKSPAVSTATALSALPTSTAILTTTGSGDLTSWSTYGYKDAGQQVDFAVDTRRFSGISLGFDIANPGGANGPDQFTVATSTGGAFTTRLTVNTPADAFTPHTLDLTGLTSTTGTTTIRISGSGAKNNQNGANLVLDNIRFTGCRESAPAPSISKAFAPDPVALGGSSTLTFTIANTAAGNADLTGIAVTDVLPEGLGVTSGSGAACGGTLARTASSGTIRLTGGTLAAGGTCTFDVTVSGEVAGQHQNVTGFLETTEGGPSTSYAADSLLVIAPPVLAKAFTPAAVRTGETSQLAFTIVNPNRTAGLSGLAFTDTLPAGMTVASSGPASRCGGSLSTSAPATVSFTGGALAANDSCSFAVTVTGATAGSKVNTTTSIASAEGGAGNAASATLAVTDLTAVLDLNKQVSTDGTTWRKNVGVAVGGDVLYRFAAYNAGDVPLGNLAVDDGGPVACTWTGASIPLAPGDTAFCVIGPVAALAGTHPNTATASATSSLGPVTSGDSTATYATTGLTIAKSADAAYFTAPGDVLHYSFVVTNSGFFPLHGPVTVNDNKASDESCPAVATVGDLDSWLDPGESVTCDATYTANAGDVSAGSVTNTASASTDGVTSPTDEVTVVLAALSIAKSATETTFRATGDVLHYAFAVANTGSVSLPGPVVVDDDKATDEACPSVATIGDLDPMLDPGETITCTATYTVAGVDVTAKQVTNAAAATAGGITSNTDTVTVDLARLSITKDSTTTSITHAGQVVPYMIETANTGAAPLTNLTVTDDLCSAAPAYVSGDTANGGVLDVGEVWVFTCSHTVTQGEMNVGLWITNTATVSSDQTGPVSASKTVDVIQAVALGVAKTTTTTSITHAGQVVPFTITAHNTGTVDLTAVLVQDAQCDAAPVYESGDTADLGVLNPGEAWAFTCSRAMTQLDIDIALAGAGTYTNTASVTTSQTGKISTTADVPVARDAALTIVKEADLTSTGSVGPIHYTITVANTGNTALSDVVLTDNLTGGGTLVSGDTGSDGVLGVGETWVYSASYTVTQADLDTGAPIVNRATASTSQTADMSDDATTTINQSPGLTVAKSSVTAAIMAAGQVVPYAITVRNSGNISLTGITVSDPACDAAPAYQSGDTGDDDILAVGETWTYTCSRTVTQAEVDAGGNLSNTVTADAVETAQASDSLDIPIVSDPALAIAKSADPVSTGATGAIEYTITVRNTGNVSLTGVTVSDPLTGGATLASGDTDDDGVLDVGETWVYRASYTVTQDDLDAGDPIVNTATVDADQAGPESDRATTILTADPSLAVAKSSATTSITAAGQVVGYAISVRNSGNIVLTAIAVSDPACDAAPAYVSGDSDDDDGLDVNERWTFACDRTVTQTEMDAGGDLSNTATATSAETDPASDTLDIPVAWDPALGLAKSLTSGVYFTNVGDVLGYAYVVTNTGNITIPGPITVADDRTEVSCPPVTNLAPGASMTCTSQDTVTATDLKAGEVTNTALAKATVGREIVASAQVAVTAFRVVPPSAPPSTAADGFAPASGPGWGLVGVLAVLGIGLLASAFVLGAARRRRRPQAR